MMVHDIGFRIMKVGKNRDFIPILRFAKAAITVNSVNFLGRAIYLSVIFGMLRNITQKSIKKME